MTFGSCSVLSSILFMLTLSLLLLMMMTTATAMMVVSKAILLHPGLALVLPASYSNQTTEKYYYKKNPCFLENFQENIKI